MRDWRLLWKCQCCPGLPQGHLELWESAESLLRMKPRKANTWATPFFDRPMLSFVSLISVGYFPHPLLLTWCWHAYDKLARPVGMRIRYAEWGCGDELIILLHDSAEAGMLWASVAQRLADLGYHVIAPDMRGYMSSCSARCC